MALCGGPAGAGVKERAGRCCVGAVIYRNKAAVPGETTSEICEPGPSSLGVCSC